jgi:hypothetical protein
MPSGRCPLSVPAPIADLMRRGSHALRGGLCQWPMGCQRLVQLLTRLLTPNTAIDVMQGVDPWAHLRSVIFPCTGLFRSGRGNLWQHVLSKSSL